VVDEAAERIANLLASMTMEMKLVTSALGKDDVHDLRPHDLAALNLEASAMAKIPLIGTEGVVSGRALAGARAGLGGRPR
jgi:methylamine---glutamate N-methyltransferase subunit C